MKKTITIMAGIMLATYTSKAQFNLADFEDLVLPSDSFHQDTTGADFISYNTIFQYDWTESQWGDYWGGGFTYSNKTDSVTAGYTNMYSARTGNAYSGSNYVVGQSNSIIKFVNTLGTVPIGFYITNSTYAYYSMQDGDMFGKKFGGPTGNDPDWFKVVIRAYSGGSLTSDSVEFYLADFRFADNSQDYIIKDWQFVNLSGIINHIDSLKFDLSSSDNSFGFMNTPAYFCMDNFNSNSLVIGLKEEQSSTVSLYPNPASHFINLQLNSVVKENFSYQITNIAGKVVLNDEMNGNGINTVIKLDGLETGIYFLRVINGTEVITKKFTKQ